jgi:2-dehydropantoate 2-reductase
VRIVVVGAGAIGSVLATALARAGEEVTLVVRARDVPSAGSLKLSVDDDGNSEQRWAIIPVISELTEAPDLIILAVKTHNVAEAANSVLRHIGDALVMTTQTGPRGDVIAGVALGQARLVSCIPWFEAVLQEPGRASVVGESHLYVGAPRGQPSVSDERVRALVAAFNQAMPTTLVPNITALHWTKLLLAVPQALSASTNVPVDNLMRDRRLIGLGVTLLREATRVLAKAEIDLAPLPGVDIARLRKFHTIPMMFATHAFRQQPLLMTASDGSSNPTLQSLRRGRPSEIDYLNGEIVRLGAEHGIPTPANARIVDLIHTIERSGTFLSVDALAKATARL